MEPFFDVSSMPLDSTIKTMGFKSENGFLVIAKGLTSYEPLLEPWLVELMISGQVLVIDTKKMQIFSVNHGDWLQLMRFSDILKQGKENDNNIEGKNTGTVATSTSNKKSKKKG